MKPKPTLPGKFPTLFFTALLAASAPAFAGSMLLQNADPTIVPIKSEPANPLSFLHGALVVDVQERLRFEVRENNYDFNDDVDALTDDSWLLQRFRLGVAVKPTSWLKIYAQVQDSREAYSDRSDIPGVLGAEGDDAFDLRQGYFLIGDLKGLSLTVGRQILSFGDERLVGSFDWNNLGRTFDAVKVSYVTKSYSVDAFASSVVVPERGSYNQSDAFNGNETNRGQIFSGLYFSTNALSCQTTDLYVLHLHENTSASYLPTAAGNTDFATFGLRFKSKPGVFHHSPEAAPATDGKSLPAPAVITTPKALGLDYDGEIAFQTGEVRGLDLTSFAVHFGTGYTFDAGWKPRVGIEYNFASGDRDAVDGDIETFQNLFPTNHKFYGYMDAFSWQNMHNPAISFSVAPCKTVTIKLDGHAFFLADTSDAWYRANGVTRVRAITPAADSYVGSEADLTISWKPTKNYALLVGYSHFFAGDYLSDTGASDDADFGYVQATVEF